MVQISKQYFLKSTYTLENWAAHYSLKLNGDKCKVLHVRKKM